MAEADLIPPCAHPYFDIVAMASSAGGLSALSSILAALAADLPVPIVVVQHLDRRRPSVMAQILNRRTSMRVLEASEGERLVDGRVYLAPPDHHLIVAGDGTCSLTHSELVHFVRPSADTLFESVASSFGKRAIAVVITGTGTDGAAGVRAIKSSGGTVVAQDKASSEFFGMPGAAIDTGCVDFVLTLEQIPRALSSLIVTGLVA